MTARLGKAEVTMWGSGISSAVRTWVTWVKERGYDRSRALARSWGEREEWGLRAPKSAKLSKRNDGPLKRVGNRIRGKWISGPLRSLALSIPQRSRGSSLPRTDRDGGVSTGIRKFLCNMLDTEIHFPLRSTGNEEISNTLQFHLEPCQQVQVAGGVLVPEV